MRLVDVMFSLKLTGSLVTRFGQSPAEHPWGLNQEPFDSIVPSELAAL